MQESVVSMQKTTLHNTSLTAAAYFLIGTLAVAQAPSTARKKLPGKMKSGQIVVTRIQSGNDSGATTPQSTPADRKDGAVIGADYNHSASARSSAHATETLAPSNNVQQGQNPLYEDSGKSGTNPLYESKDRASNKTNAGDSGTPASSTDKFKQDFGQVQASRKELADKPKNAAQNKGNTSSSQK